MGPLVKKVTKGIDDIGLAELGLNEIHNIRKVCFAAVLPVYNGHGGKRKDTWRLFVVSKQMM